MAKNTAWLLIWWSGTEGGRPRWPTPLHFDITRHEDPHCVWTGVILHRVTHHQHTHTYTHTHLLITVFCSSSLAWWKRLWQRKTFPSNWPPKMWLSSRFDWTHNSPAHLRPLTVELPSYSSLILTSCLELVQLFAIFFFFLDKLWTNFFFLSARFTKQIPTCCPPWTPPPLLHPPPTLHYWVHLDSGML